MRRDKFESLEAYFDFATKNLATTILVSLVFVFLGTLFQLIAQVVNSLQLMIAGAFVIGFGIGYLCSGLLIYYQLKRGVKGANE